MKQKPKLPAIIAREKIGLTRAQAAKKLRLSVRTIAEYEAGRGQSFFQAKRIAKLYKCKVFGDLTQQGLAVNQQRNRDSPSHGLQSDGDDGCRNSAPATAQIKCASPSLRKCDGGAQ